VDRLAVNVRALREAKGWSQAELSERSKVPQSSIHYIEAGSRRPRIDTLQSLATALGVTVAELLDESDGHVA